jgi:hypothetical protein
MLPEVSLTLYANFKLESAQFTLCTKWSITGQREAEIERF